MAKSNIGSNTLLERDQDQLKEEILNGPILKTVLKLAWPIMIGNGMQVIYNLTDTFWLGKVGAEAVASISMGFPIVFLLISLGGGITIAGTTLVAQYTGAGEEETKNTVAGQILITVLIISITLSIIGLYFSKDILQLLGTPPEILESTNRMIRIYFSGLSFMFLFFIFSNLLRGYGDTKTPMKMMVASVLLNVILDPFFIFGWSFFPRMEVAGAAFATIFSRGLAGIIGLIILIYGKKGIIIRFKNIIPDLSLIKKVLQIGLPSAGEMTFVALGMMVMMSIVSRFGAMAVASFGIGARLLSVVMMPTRGMGRATTTMVGQNLGAEKNQRAEKTAWISTGVIFVLLTLLWLVMVIAPRSIIILFNDNPEVVKMGTSFLKIVGFSFGFLGIRLVLAGSFRGAGNTLTAMVLAIIALWVLRLPIVYYLSINLNWEVTGIWWGMAIGNIISGFISMFWFKQGKWKGKTIKTKNKEGETLCE